MTYKPSDELTDHINSMDIQSYRLVDGSYLVAEEIDCDEVNNVLFIAGALALERDGDDGKAYLRPWLDNDGDDLVQLLGDKIIGRTDTPFALKLNYYRYFIHTQLKEALSNSALEDLFNDQVDNQDLTDDSEFNQPLSDIHTQWRKKFRDNN